MYGAKMAIMETWHFNISGCHALAMERLAKAGCERKFKESILSDLLIPVKIGNWLVKVINSQKAQQRMLKVKFLPGYSNFKTYKVDVNGKLTGLNIDAKKASGTCFGADGKRYTVPAAQNKY